MGVRFDVFNCTADERRQIAAVDTEALVFGA